MTGKYRKFSPEFREEAARMVIETSSYCRCRAGAERAWLRELEREVGELRMKADFLSKAAAYFAAEHR